MQKGWGLGLGRSLGSPALEAAPGLALGALMETRQGCGPKPAPPDDTLCLAFPWPRAGSCKDAPAQSS